MKYQKLHFLTILALSITCQPGFSQSGFVPYSSGYVAERQEAYTVRASSSEDLNAIPLYEVYQTVFLKILGNPLLYQQLSEFDAQILLNLPDHTDISFQGPLRADLRFACQEIENRLGKSPAHELVSVFMNAEEIHETKLLRHYENVIRRLSNSGKQLVENQIEKLSEGNSLAYSEMDYVGFSEEFPDLMESRLLGGCERIRADVSVPRQKLLTDNFIHRDDFQLGSQ